MFVCICARVRECELRAAIRRGAHNEEAIADECGAGTGCGTCSERIAGLLDEQVSRNTLAGAAQ